MITFTAPGKAVLAGEYVVLQDAPAISAALDRRVRISLEETADESHVLSAPGYLDGSWRFLVSEAGKVDWQDSLPEPSSFRLVEEVWESFDTSQWPALALVIDSRQFCDAASGVKLGLGSSAAVCVALAATLQEYAGAGGAIEDIARNAHDRFQCGRGSGIDVATSLHGGVIQYRRADFAVQHVEWPAGLHYRYLWSGQSVATAEKLEKLGRSLDQASAGDGMNLLGEHARHVSAAWLSGDTSRILESFPDYVDALRAFSVDHDLGIFDAGHEKISRQASDSGIVYKPCGAGGGDIGIVLAASQQAVDEFCKQARPQDFHVLDIALDDQGVLLTG